MCAVPRAARCLAALLAVVVLVPACSESGSPASSVSPSVPLPTLPPGELRERVLQPGEVGSSLVPIAAQTGARDVKGIAAFSANPKAAEKTLEKNGFQAAYVVQYADPATSAVVTNVVTKYSASSGATADLTADLASSDRTGTPFAVTGLGDQAGGVRGKRDDASADGTIVTLRWRSGDTTWLLAVSASTPVDEAGVRKLADRLMERLASEA